MIKLDQEGHLTQKEKQNKQQVKKIIEESASQLKPADFLTTRKQKKLFRWFVASSEDIPLAEIDEIQLSMLVMYISYYAEAAKIIKEDGIIIGTQKNPAFLVMKDSQMAITQIMKDLNLSMNQRVKQLLNNVHNEEINDPFKELLDNDD